MNAIGIYRQLSTSTARVAPTPIVRTKLGEASVDNSESPQRGYSVGASLLLGLVMFFVYELFKDVVSERLAVLGVVTISLAWAVVSTLRQYWRRKGFWWLLGGLFILHIGYMWAVYNYLTNLDVKTGLVICPSLNLI